MISSLVGEPWPIYLPDPVNRDHPANRGRVALWSVVPNLDGGRYFYDLMGLNHAALSGGYSWTPSGVRFNQAAQGKGLVGTQSQLSLATAFSVSAWITIASPGTPSFPAIISKGTNYTIQTFNNTRRSLRYYNLISTYDDTYVIPYDTLTHVGVTCDNTNVRFFVNGVNTSTTAATMGATNSNNVYIGWFDGGNAGHNWDGLIDKLTVFNRAISAQEMFAEYNLSRQGYPGVLNRWKPSITTFLGTAAPVVARFLSLLGVGS